LAKHAHCQILKQRQKTALLLLQMALLLRQRRRRQQQQQQAHCTYIMTSERVALIHAPQVPHCAAAAAASRHL
jgi:hypothetical protein